MKLIFFLLLGILCVNAFTPVQYYPRFKDEMSEESGEESSNLADLISNMHLVATEEEGDKDKELEEALQTAKDQIVAKANSIKSEKKWVKEVTEIIEQYVKKTRRVNAHIREMQLEVKNLFRKKKQIENMILQRKLEQKLRVANADLNVLGDALTNVQKKKAAFEKSQHDIKNTIGSLTRELKVLRGNENGEESTKESAEESAEESGEESGEESTKKKY